MNRVNFKEIILAFKDIAVQTRFKYPNLINANGFGFGNLENINTKDINGVYLYLQPTESTINNTTSNLTFNLYVMDLIENADSDYLLDVMSNTVNVITDIIKMFSSMNFKKKYNFWLDTQATVSPFNGSFEQITAGWVAELNFTTYNGQACKTNFENWFNVSRVEYPSSGFTGLANADVSGFRFSNLLATGDIIYLSDNFSSETKYVVRGFAKGGKNVLVDAINVFATINKMRLNL